MSSGDHLDVQSKVVVITGGTRGIGRVIAARYLAGGAEVVVCGRSEPSELPAYEGRSARFVAADIRDPEQAAHVIAEAVAAFGRLDVLINNAGGSPAADAATVSPRFFAAILALNLTAPFYMAQSANAAMQGQESGGVIINIGSVSSRTPAPGTAAYSTAKAGLTMLTRALALEWSPRVRVNQVTVGLVHTELSAQTYGDQSAMEALAAVIPMQRMASPDDVASACLLLGSSLASYVTGAELVVDGGGEVPARFIVSDPA